ncbi:peptide chain release factor 2 [Hippea maritima]|uniref:Peptide chain release factor 2 n=1 Tax=Hippea maritima (strain ATCC 700847 / DSM 10411 / MH2) TaxID=760142 RepID=F2LTJ2_HIPMA|nr:peptide chain release factor 2 [Hippea maritima]AEA33317.1 peptide chain release factor 2 [Hippea maritima DSM 10411]
MKEEIIQLADKINKIKEYLDPPKRKKELDDIQKQLEDSSVWNDYQLLQNLKRKQSSIEQKLKTVEELENDVDTLLELSEFVEDDESYKQELEDNIKELTKKVEKAETETFLSGEHDFSNAIVTIHSGAGGTESCDWVSMLFRMYSMWCDNNEYKIEVMDLQPGDEAGYKSITFLVSGEKAYGYLKNENGVHRLVRISPFDANKRRHTSFASVSVLPEINDDTEIDIDPKDLKIDTFRASGAGGQHVNKTDSAIRITHIPTGIVVSCQNERSQHKNKAFALKILKAKLYQLEEEKKKKELEKLEGEKKKIEWGSQIRSYVLHPYKMVKDHRTGVEKKDVAALAVLNGEIDDFIREALKKL